MDRSAASPPVRKASLSPLSRPASPGCRLNGPIGRRRLTAWSLAAGPGRCGRTQEAPAQGCIAGLAPHMLHCFSRIIQQQSRPSGKKQMASTMPHGVKESVRTPFCGQREAATSGDLLLQLVVMRVTGTSSDSNCAANGYCYQNVY